MKILNRSRLLPIAIVTASALSGSAAVALSHPTDQDDVEPERQTLVVDLGSSAVTARALNTDLGRKPTDVELITTIASQNPNANLLIRIQDDLVTVEDSLEPEYKTSNKRDGDVWHTITGWKDYVSGWSTWAKQYATDPTVCNPVARYWENGVIIDTEHFDSGCQAPPPAGTTNVYYSELHWMPAFFDNWDLLCNSFTPGNPLNGQPCSIILS